MTTRIRFAFAAALLTALPVCAQDWPNRTVKVIVPFPPGGRTDPGSRPLTETLSYDLEKDLVPVTTVAIFPDVLVAAAKVPASTLPELIAHAKAQPGALN